jgi:hypothetical protein
MKELKVQAAELVEMAEVASHAERMKLQPQIDRVVTTLTMQGQTVPCKLRNINNALKDEALDDMFDNLPV